MYVYMYVCMYVCMYIYMYIYIYMYVDRYVPRLTAPVIRYPIALRVTQGRLYRWHCTKSTDCQVRVRMYTE